MDDQERNELTAKLQRVQRIRRITVVVALVVLVLSISQPQKPLISWCSSGLWALAGVMRLVEGSLARRLGLGNALLVVAILYFVVAAMPFWRHGF